MKMKTLIYLIFSAIALTTTPSWSVEESFKLFVEGIFANEAGDHKTAAKKFTEAANKGNAEAAGQLAIMYTNGDGVIKDDQASFRWNKVAAELGDSDSQAALGYAYITGKGVQKDFKLGVTWLKLAAEKGDDGAQLNLAISYYNGQGVLQDNIYAYMWANIAGSNGSEQGPQLRNKVAQEMSQSQIEKAQTLSRECVNKKYKGC